jgi:hypothetical protein
MQQQEAKRKAEAAKEAARLSTLQMCSVGPIAKTLQGADELIAEDKEDLKAQQDYIKQTEQESSTAPDPYQERPLREFKPKSPTCKKTKGHSG